MKKSYKCEQGISIVLFVFCLPLLLILAAIAVDSGRLYLAKNELKRTTDMSALSAVGALPQFYNGGVETKVAQLAEMFNGTPGSNYVNDILGSIDPQIDFSTDGSFVGYDFATRTVIPSQLYPPFDRIHGVSINHSLDIPALFTRVIGFDSFRISAKSTAILSGPRCFPVEFPVALLTCETGNNNCSDPTCGGTYEARLTSSVLDNAGIFATIPNPNANHCRDIVNGNIDTSICVGDTIHLNNGGLTSCLHDMEAECNARNCDTPGPSPWEPWEVFIPYIDCSEYDLGGGNFNDQPRVAGITKIAVTYIDDQGSDKRIEFTRVCDDIVFGPPGGGSVCGVYTAPMLVE